jgi:hypothetical protein
MNLGLNPVISMGFGISDASRAYEAGKGLFCCPGKGQIRAAKTRPEMPGREALPRLPQSNAGDLRKLLSIQKDDCFGFCGLNTEWATKKSAPVLAA